MNAATCPFCSARLPAWEVDAAWCDGCRKVLPAGRAMPAGTGASRTPISLSAPVAGSAWPTVRWVVQIVSGLFLVLSLGGLLTSIVLLSRADGVAFTFAWGFGPLVGLPLAAVINGALVGTRGRRLTLLGVAAVVAAAFALGFLLYGAGALLR